MPSRLLVLGAGPAQLGLLAAARERGLFVIACDRDPAAPGFAYADRRAIVSAEDEEALDRLARAELPNGIVAPGIDWPVAIAARLAARLGLPHPISPETAALAVSKVRQRERFAEAGVAQPRSAVAADVSTARAAAAEVGYPCVLKAPDRQGQRGLSLVRTPEELEEAVGAAIESSRSGTCLVEELIEGPEVTVNAFSTEGTFHPLTVTDRAHGRAASLRCGARPRLAGSPWGSGGGRGRRSRRRSARDRERPHVHPGRARPGRRPRRRAGRPARWRARCRAVPRCPRRRPERPRSGGSARRGARSHRAAGVWRRVRSLPGRSSRRAVRRPRARGRAGTGGRRRRPGLPPAGVDVRAAPPGRRPRRLRPRDR